MAVSKDLIAASSTPLILSILSEGESYGYAIIKRVHELSGGQLHWTDGMLYPVLHRLEKQKLIQSSWRQSETGRKRKYYKIKERGIKSLEQHKSQWKIVYSTLAQLWEAEPCLT
ncbi:MAG: helix-turn-helix transcriptional regulator [Planctomycetota bacterium]